MQLINLLPCICVFSTSIFRPQNYLAYACCMKPGCSEMIQSVSPHRAARNTSLLHHSLLTTYYHTDTVLTSSLEVLHTLWCTLVCRNSVKLNFVKTGLKFEFAVNPQSFSHELCLYITRFTVLKATESWAGPGNEATTVIYRQHVPTKERVPKNSCMYSFVR